MSRTYKSVTFQAAGVGTDVPVPIPPCDPLSHSNIESLDPGKWVGVGFTPDGANPVRLQGACVELRRIDEDGARYAVVIKSPAGTSMETFPSGTAGTFSALFEDQTTGQDWGFVLTARPAKVVYSDAGNLFLAAVSADGVTSPLMFSAGPSTVRPETAEERERYRARATSGLWAMEELGNPEEQRQSLERLMRGVDEERPEGSKLFEGMY